MLPKEILPSTFSDQLKEYYRNHKEYIDDGRIEFVVADGRKGLPEYAPYDVIFVGGGKMSLLSDINF